LAILRGANLALRFLLELCILAALAYWGFRAVSGPLTKILLGVGGPVLAAIVWGTFLSPKASATLSAPWKLVLEIVVFGVAIVALYAAGQQGLAVVFALLALLSRSLLSVWHQ
jgi:hypothetical protein